MAIAKLIQEGMDVDSLNDVFVVQGKGKKEILVPYIDDCVKNVSMEEKKVTVVLLPGMDE